jgi:hypothetical protein
MRGTEKEIPNQKYSWIVKGNQHGYEASFLNNDKILIDDVFHIVFEKPPDKHTSQDEETKDDNT